MLVVAGGRDGAAMPAPDGCSVSWHGFARLIAHLIVWLPARWLARLLDGGTAGGLLPSRFHRRLHCRIVLLFLLTRSSASSPAAFCIALYAGDDCWSKLVCLSQQIVNYPLEEEDSKASIYNRAVAGFGGYWRSLRTISCTTNLPAPAPAVVPPLPTARMPCST